MPESKIERPRFCSQCGKPVVVADASFCKECGAPLAGTVWFSHDIAWRPLTAFLLSVIPGLGQWYKGQPFRALVWLAVVGLFYAGGSPLAPILHLVCAGNAALAGALREDAFARSGRRIRRRGFSATADPRP
jgi:TM2 domain-containing membrane protein YozV